MKDSLGDRMKKYEDVSRIHLTPRSSVIIRLDGRSFHNFTQGFVKPFDEFFVDCMEYASEKVAKSIQGFKLGYVQSDEASFLLTDFDDFHTQGWFDYNLQKMVSIVASTMTAYFIKYGWNKWCLEECKTLPTFDARCFNLPRDDVENYFLFRSLDWQRNSVQMYCSSFFSHKQMQNKNREEQHEMLHSIGKNWTTDLSDRLKNGTFIVKKEIKMKKYYYILPNYSDVSMIVEQALEGLETDQERILREIEEDSDINAHMSPY